MEATKNENDSLAIEESDYFEGMPSTNKLVAQMLMFSARVLPGIAAIN